VRDGETALICGQGRPRELAMRIRQALTPGAPLDAMIAVAKAEAQSRFRPSEVLADYQRLYESMTAAETLRS
ncbi:MAG: hypothetical protein PHU85_09955, partial [Phycisphaerae bacterium]|nr:hypothetical protein [Phycisphaerae bacterium]